MAAPAIEFKNIHKDYGSGFRIENFNLAIPQRKIVTIIGPSGSGKTTLLKMINRLVEPDEGSIHVAGSDISRLKPEELRRSIGYVIQQIGLFPHMTIEDNISIVPRLKGGKRHELKKLTEELLILIGLQPEQFRRRYPDELSGGQQQRIGVARALAADPSIILMDEPFSALDPISREQLQRELVKLNESVNKTIIFVTHDIDEALKIADLIVLLKDGKLVQYDVPDRLLEEPKDAFVRSFIGEDRIVLNAERQQNARAADSVVTTVRDIMLRVNVVRQSDLVSHADRLAGLPPDEVIVVTDDQGQYIGNVQARDMENVVAWTGEGIGNFIRQRMVPCATEDLTLSSLFVLLEKSDTLPVVNRSKQVKGIVTRDSFLANLGRHFERMGTDHE